MPLLAPAPLWGVRAGAGALLLQGSDEPNEDREAFFRKAAHGSFWLFVAATFAGVGGFCCALLGLLSCSDQPIDATFVASMCGGGVVGMYAYYLHCQNPAVAWYFPAGPADLDLADCEFTCGCAPTAIRRGTAWVLARRHPRPWCECPLGGLCPRAVDPAIVNNTCCMAEGDVVLELVAEHARQQGREQEGGAAARGEEREEMAVPPPHVACPVEPSSRVAVPVVC